RVDALIRRGDLRDEELRSAAELDAEVEAGEEVSPAAHERHGDRGDHEDAGEQEPPAAVAHEVDAAGPRVEVVTETLERSGHQRASFFPVDGFELLLPAFAAASSAALRSAMV